MNKHPGPPVIFLMGPTATGKTEIAVALQRYFACSLVSVDSAMVYRDMNIGTDKPSPALLARVPHRLIDICDPAESYSAARFFQDAKQAIQAIQAQGKLPLLVGGTGLYFRVLERGLALLPYADPALRARLTQAARECGWPALHERLRQVDPVAAARIHPHDGQRIQRALEVWELTRTPFSSHFASRHDNALSAPIIKLIVVPDDRVGLRQRIARRFLGMLQHGLIEEVEALFARTDMHADLPSMRLIGYRQIWSMLDGTIDRRTMQEQTLIATAQLAKRQLTWLRAETCAERFVVPMTGNAVSTDCVAQLRACIEARLSAYPRERAVATGPVA